MSGPVIPAGDRRLGRFLMQVLWPSFLTAIVATGVFFSMVDPQELVLMGVSLAHSREGAYTAGFFVFWFLFALSSSLTWLLANGLEPPGRAPVMPAAPHGVTASVAASGARLAGAATTDASGMRDGRSADRQ